MFRVDRMGIPFRYTYTRILHHVCMYVRTYISLELAVMFSSQRLSTVIMQCIGYWLRHYGESGTRNVEKQVTLV